MLNAIWVGLIVIGVVVAGSQGRIDVVTSALFSEADKSITVALNLLAIVPVWLGVSKVAEKAGLLQGLARILSPLLRLIFPGIARSPEAMGHVAMNLTANFLGLGNAATPFGLKAMQELQKLNDRPDTATQNMISFLAVNSTCVTILPANMVALRALYGSANPAEIVVATFLATGFSTLVGLTADRVFRRIYRGAGR